MQRAVMMDQRRVDDLLLSVQGLRFFQQMPRHLALRFVQAMTLRRLAAEALVWHAAIPGQPAEEGEMCIITKGAVAVYGDRAKVAAPMAAVAEAVAKAGDSVLPVHGSAGHADDGDAPRFVLPPGIAPGSEAATAAAAAAAIAAAQRRRGPRHLQSATAGSISLPSNTTLNVNPVSGSVSLPAGIPSPLTGLGAEKPAESKQFSLVLTRPKGSPPAGLPGYEDELRSSPIHEGVESEQPKGISLVPGWVTPPSSDDDSSGSESDGEGGRREKKSAESDADESDATGKQLTAEERRLASLAATEAARTAVAQARALEESRAHEAELEALAAEERELRLLEEAHARREMECVTTLRAGDCFGLLTILEKAPRSSTLVALDDTELACLSRSSYERIMRELNSAPRTSPKSPLVPRCNIPSLAKYLRLLRMPAEQREDAQLNYLAQPLLAHNRLLQQLDSRALMLLASGMKYLSIHKSGVVLARQGTEANWCYIVLQGSVSEHYLPPAPPAPEVSFEGQTTRRSGEDASRPGSPSRRGGRPSTASSHSAAGQSTAATPAAVGGISSDILTSFGACSRILLTGDMSLFPDVDVGAPTFWSNHRASYLTREPVVLAKISYDYLSHVLLGCNRPLKGVDAIREALETPPGDHAHGGRSEVQLDVLDNVLKNVTLFQFKPVKLRKQLCARMTLQRFGFDTPSDDVLLIDPEADTRPTPTRDERKQTQVIFAQGQSSDAFYILLSGSVSIHQKLLDDSDGSGAGGDPAPHVKWDANTALGSALPPYAGYDILKTFGACLSLGRAGSHFGDQALISTQARNLSILTRGPVEVAVVSRKDYNAVFIPIADELSYHASKALQLLSRPHRSPAIVNTLVDVLKNIPYFSDMPVSLRSFAIRHMEVETIEGDTVVFLEDDPADYLYVIMSGSVGVHIADKKAKEIAKAAKAEREEHGEAGAIVSEAVQAAREAEAREKMDAVAAQIVSDGLQEEAAAKSKEETLAVQMRKDAEAEVKRLQREQKQQSLGRKASRNASDSSESGSSSDSDSSDDEKKPAAAATKGEVPLAASAAGRLLGSSRGDVFTASGAGQYALAQRLRAGSFVGASSGVAGGAAADGGKALAHLKKSGMNSEADALRKKMQAAAQSQDGDDGLMVEEGDAASVVSADGSTTIRPRTAGKASTSVPAPERMQVGHLSASERTEQFGPCVVQLPSGSVVGEVALTNANQKLLRTASIITMEPTFFVKLAGEVVKRITFGGAGSGAGAAGTPGAGGLTQDQIANFLKELDALKVVKGSATGAGTGSHATFKRLAYHMKDRRLAPGYKIVEQGSRADSVFFIIQGSVLVQRHLLVTGLRPTGPSIPLSAAAEGSVTVGSDSIFVHPQRPGEPFQRVETTFIPPATKEEAGMVPPLPFSTPAPAAGTTVQGAEKVERPLSAGSLTAAAVTAAAAAASASRSGEIPPGLPPPAHGLPLHAELTVLGKGEQFGSLECLNGGLYGCTFVVSSSDCVVLQMKRNHFLNLFPVRALDSLRDLGQQRSKVHAARASKFVAMRTGHMNLHPLVAALQNMVGSLGAMHKDPEREEEEKEEENEPSVPLPPSLLTLAGSTPAIAAKDPLRKKGLVHAHALRSPIAGNSTQSSGQSGAASLMALASPGAAAVARKLRGEGEAQADAEAAALEGLGPLASSKSLIQQLLPVTSPLSANSVLTTPPRHTGSAATSPRAAAVTPVSPAHAAHTSAPATPSFKPRDHVLSPPSSRGPQLQSASLMHSLQLVEQRSGTPLTPVQKALGLEGDPKENLALSDRAFSWTPKADGARPSTAMTPTRRNAVGEALMTPQRSPKNAAAARPSTTQTGRDRDSPSGTDSVAQALWPTDDQLPASTQFAVSVSSAGGGVVRPSSSSHKKKRGSINVASLPSSSDDRHSSSLGSGVSYLPLAPILHATPGQIAAFSATLTLPQSSGNIGVDSLSGSGPNGSFSARDRQLEDQLAGAISARQLSQAQNPHANKSNLPALAAPPASVTDVNITPRRGSMTQSEALLQAMDGTRTANASPTHAAREPTQGQTSAQALAASAAAAAVQSLDVESRALVLMRAEKLQMKWERDETHRRGHKIPEKVRPTSYNVSQELKQAQLSASLSWDQVHLNTDESKTSNAFLHSASPPLAVMNVSLAPKDELMKRSRSLENAADRSAENQQAEQQQQEEQVLDPSMTAATIQALLARSEALTQSTSASAVAAAALSRGKAGRAFSAAKKDPADLVSSPSPIIRSLLHPLVETGFTSLFAAAAEGSHSHIPPVGAGSDGAALFSITSRVASPGKILRSPPSKLLHRQLQQHHDGRPATAGELGRSASQRSLNGSGANSRVGTPARNSTGGLRPSTSSASLGSSSLDLATRELERQHPFLRFAQPASAVQDVPIMDASASTLANRHRVSSATMSRSASGSRLPNTRQQQQQQRPATSGGGLRSSASAASLPRSQHGSGTASPVRSSNRGGNITPGAPSSQNFFSASPVSAPSTMQKPPPALHVASVPGTPIVASDAMFSPASSSSSVACPALTPLRHTRTSSLGSFMALSSAGVERKPSVVQAFGSPHLHAAVRGEAIVEEALNEEEEKQQQDSNSSHQTTRRADLMSGLRRADGSRPSSANDRPLVLGRAPSVASSSSSLFSPSSSSSSTAAVSPDPGYATLGGHSHPSIRKTSYIDHRAEAASESRRIVIDAHQSVYSRAQHGSMLPGEKNLVAGGADGEDLSKEEAEAIRRKRMFGVVAPTHRGNPENPTGFSKVVALSENLPGALLASRNAAGSRKARLEEAQAARAAKEDGFVASIMQGFKEAVERTPQ